jgi:hypothetical protein
MVFTDQPSNMTFFLQVYTQNNVSVITTGKTLDLPTISYLPLRDWGGGGIGEGVCNVV